MRFIGIAEGISFLVLLLIGMPLKYLWGIPEMVTVAGWMHGLLFILYIVAVVFSIRTMNWKFFAVLVAMGASLIPLGTFVLDKQLRSRQNELSKL